MKTLLKFLILSLFVGQAFAQAGRDITTQNNLSGGGTVVGPLLLQFGTAAAPGLAFSADTTTGIFRKAASTIGFTGGGTQIGQLAYWLVNGTQPGAQLVLGVPGLTVNSEANEFYIGTISPQSASISGTASAYVGLNIGNTIVTATDQITKTSQQVGVELDRLQLSQSGGAMTFNIGIGARATFPYPTTGVTLVSSRAIEIGDLSPFTGTLTQFEGIHFRPMASPPGGTATYGLFFEDAPTGGSISGGSGVNINFNSQGGVVNLQYNGLTGFQQSVVGSSHNYIQSSSNNTPLLLAQGSGTNIGLGLSTKGSSPLQFFTNAEQQEQLRIPHTANAQNPLTIAGGINGAGPTISALSNDSETSLNINLAPLGTGVVAASSAITTATPNGGTGGAWKFGVLVSSTCTPDATKYIQLDVGGVLYKIGTCS